jgi:hypothetical protein
MGYEKRRLLPRLKLYKEIDDPAEQLRKFRATHSSKQRYVAGVDWEYILSGCGEEALLLLPGAHGLGEVAFQLILPGQLKWKNSFRSSSTFYRRENEATPSERPGPIRL